MLTFIFAMVAMFIELSDDTKGVPETNPSPKGVFLAFGVILYAASGCPVFPTIQQDMEEPAKFSKALVYSYACKVKL